MIHPANPFAPQARLHRPYLYLTAALAFHLAIASYLTADDAGILPKVANIAHRGLSSKFKDNTLDAIRAAWGADADIVELDLQQTADGKLVLFHDPKVKGKALEQLTYQELQQATPHIDIPTLDQALPIIPPSKALLLDLKIDSEKFLADLSDFILRAEPKCRLIIQARRIDSLLILKRLLPSQVSLHLVANLNNTSLIRRRPHPEELANRLASVGLHGISVKSGSRIDAKFVAAFKAREMRVFVWTLNRKDQMKRYIELGIDGVVTDHPQRFNDALSETKE